MIAFFDSGLGGLTLLREVQTLLPQHDIFYLADTAFCPYGLKSDNTICHRAHAIAHWLQTQGVTMIVIACNTATLVALETLRKTLALPVIGVEPGIRQAASVTVNRRIGVLATQSTLQSTRFTQLIRQHASHYLIVPQPGAGLVEQVEQGDIASPQTYTVLQRALAPLLAQDIDTLVLGCTHYLFLRPLIADIVGSSVTLIDTNALVAQHIARIVAVYGIVPGARIMRYGTTRDAIGVTAIAQHLSHAHIEMEQISI